MGSATSYPDLASNSKGYEFHISSQTALPYAFAVNVDDGCTVTITTNNSYESNWEATTYTTAGDYDVIVIKTKDDTGRILGNSAGTGGDPDIEDFFCIFSIQVLQTNQDSGQIYWVNEVPTISPSPTGNSDIFTNAAVNDFTLTDSPSGDGGGDPHIYPYINPFGEKLILPHSDKVYNYFALHTDNEILTVNTQMWHLSFDRIVFAEELRRDLYELKGKPELFTKEKEEILPKAIENIAANPVELEDMTESDVSFNRYITFNYVRDGTCQFNFTVDLESLDVVNAPKSSYLKISNAKNVKSLYSKRTHRRVTVFTEALKSVSIELIRKYDRLNHRNDLVLIMDKLFDRNDMNKYNVGGALVHPDRIHTVPDLTTTDMNLFVKEDVPELLSNFAEKNTKKLRKRRFEIRGLVRKHDFSLLK